MFKIQLSEKNPCLSVSTVVFSTDRDQVHFFFVVYVANCSAGLQDLTDLNKRITCLSKASYQSS